MIIIAFSRAFTQLSDRAFRRVMWQSLAVTVAIFSAFAGLFSWGFEAMWDWLGLPFASLAVSLGGVAIFLISMWILGPVLVTSVISMFLDKIIITLKWTIIMKSICQSI